MDDVEGVVGRVWKVDQHAVVVPPWQRAVGNFGVQFLFGPLLETPIECSVIQDIRFLVDFYGCAFKVQCNVKFMIVIIM